MFKKKWPRCWGGRSRRPAQRKVLMEAVQELAPAVDIESACDALGMARASFYRLRPEYGPTLPLPVIVRSAPARALSAEERQAVRGVLNSERFQDCSPAA